MKKLIASIAASGVLVGGAFTANLVGPVVLAGAQESDTAPESTDTPEHDRPKCDVDRPEDPSDLGPRARVLLKSLDELVAEGTLTQAQAEAVVQRVGENAAELRDRFCDGDRPGDRPGGEFVRRVIQQGVRIAADMIGIDENGLMNQVRNGKSISEIAEQHGVDPSDIADALVAAGNAAIDEAVANGDLGEEQAAKLKEKLPELADRFVNHSGEPGNRDGGRPAPGPDGATTDQA